MNSAWVTASATTLAVLPSTEPPPPEPTLEERVADLEFRVGRLENEVVL